jgi:hypothetical protein
MGRALGVRGRKNRGQVTGNRKGTRKESGAAGQGARILTSGFYPAPVTRYLSLPSGALACFDASRGIPDLVVSSVRLTTKVSSEPASRMISFWCLKRL